MKTLSRFSPIVGLFLVGLAALTAFAGEPVKPLPSIGLTRVTTQRVPNQKLATYPNGKILVAEPAVGGKRYVLVPVVITNCWDSIPLYSFQFSVEYDQEVLQAVAVQKTGPAPLQNLGLSKDFNITWHDTIDTRPPQGQGVFTRQITISGSSSTPLALTTPPGNDCRQSDTVDFLYIKFLVKKRAGEVPSASLLRIPNDTMSLFWNDYTPKNLFPTSFLLNADIGLCGPDSIDATGSVSYGANPVSGRGRGNVVITKQPGIDLSFADADVIKLDNYNYSFTDVLYADSNSTNPRSHLLDVIDSVADTRIVNLTLCSNEPWLLIGNNPFAGSSCYTLSPDLDYTTNALLRSQSVYIIADPNYFATQNSPDYTAGVYNGVVTFTSDEAGNAPTKLNVAFIYMRNPVEPSGDPLNTTENSGIHLVVQNSKAVPDTSILTFGTGIGATDGVDSLFGERYQAGIPGTGTFFARWFPSDDPNASTANGLGDVGDVHTYLGSRGASRDIRAYRTDSTIKYLCRFSPGTPNNYPVVVQWDISEFPPGARLMLRDTLNGSRFSVDMRKSTGTQVQSFTIRDRDISSFILEYTPGSIAVTPGIVRGWNLVSLPVVVPDNSVINVFPNALNNHTAFLFFQDDYQQVNSLDFGRGYFVKWGNIITQSDTEVAGIKKLEIFSGEVTVSDGWNAIGSLSAPTGIAYVALSQRGNTAPTLGNLIYAYDDNRGYRPTSVIMPGRGYWANVHGDAYLTMTVGPWAFQSEGGAQIGKEAAELSTLLNHLEVRDNAQRDGEVYFGTTSKKMDLDYYALPPVPPVGSFDVRFATNRSVESNVGTSGSVLRFQTTDYPVVLSANNVRGNYVVTDLNGKTLGEFVDGQDNQITIANRNVKAVNIMAKSSTQAANMPVTEDLTQNFPNPFNPTTEFFYSVPTDELVTVKLVNALGQEVTTLVNGSVKAGTYKVTVDASQLPTGIYYYKMQAGNFSATRKMILAK